MDGIRGEVMNLAGMKELTIDRVKLRELSVGGTKIWQAGRLPAGYTEVEYIHTDGDCYFDTGVIPSDYPDGIRIDLDFTLTEYITGNVYTYYFGCISGNCRSGNFAINPTAGNFRVYVGSTSPYMYNWVDVLNRRTLISMFANSMKPSDVQVSMKIGGAEHLSVMNTYSSSAQPMPNESIHLLNCRGITRSGVKGMCHGGAMYAADGTPIREYKTVITPTGEAGLYDLVNMSLCPKMGTGTLTAGPAV